MTTHEAVGTPAEGRKRERELPFEATFSALTRLSEVGKYFRAYCYRSVGELGFSANEVDVLLSLRQHPERNTVKSLSETVHLSKGMISQAVERLRQRKFVTVDPDEKDRRSVRVHLSGESRPVLDRLLSDYVEFVNRMFAGISGERLEEALAVLKQLCQNKEEMKKSYVNKK